MFATTTGQNGWAFLVALTLHLLCVVVGFGGVMLNAIWGSAQAKLSGPEAGAIGQPMQLVNKVAEIFILLVPVFGIAAVLLSHDAFSFKDPWVSGSLVLYFVALAVSFGLLQPTAKELGPLTFQQPAGSADRVALEKKIAASSGVLHLLFAVILLLMVFGPFTTWLVH